MPARLITHLRRASLIGVLVLATAGCASLGYYGQAVSGQFEIWRKRESIDVLLADPALPGATRRKLALVVAAREFAADTLALPDQGSYRDYVELDREFVVWNVFVAPALGLEARESCFLIVGCLAYRGYFARSAAEAFAAMHRAGGDDVYVGGVAAYSTLGWFADPVLSTVLAWDDDDIVEILFHELAHQRVYVNGDTAFNESFAVAVATAGLERWHRQHGAQASSARSALDREAELMQLIMRSRDELAALYASNLRDTDKLAAKTQIFTKLREAYEVLKATWGGAIHYDVWMASPWNNAKMASVATYNEYVAGFLDLLTQADGDFAAFYAKVENLAGMAGSVRANCLSGYEAGSQLEGCP